MSDHLASTVQVQLVVARERGAQVDHVLAGDLVHHGALVVRLLPTDRGAALEVGDPLLTGGVRAGVVVAVARHEEELIAVTRHAVVGPAHEPES